VFQIVGVGTPTDLDGAVDVNVAAAERLEALRAARAEIPDGNPGAAVVDAQIAALEAQAEDGPTVTQTEGGEVVRTYTGDEFMGEKLATARTGSSFLDHGIEKWRE